MSRRAPQPLLMCGERPILPERVPVGSPPFSEVQLQAILERNPEILPVGEFDPIFGPAICIGREVSTGAGPLDNLYISPNGYLTLVETKLWKSPEARRQVVAQVIDYGRRLVRWDYTRVDDVFRQYAKQRGLPQQSLYEYVCDRTGETRDEREFVDAVCRCLANSRILLLIVGDGIREGVAEMASYLQETPNLRFTLGLVELARFRLPVSHEEPSLLLVPRVVTRTVEVTRAIVRIAMSDEAAARVAVSTELPPPDLRPPPLPKEEFYSLLSKAAGADAADTTRSFVNDLVESNELLQEHFTPTRLYVKLDLPESEENPMPILDFTSSGSVRTTRWLAQFLPRNGYLLQIAETFYSGLAQINHKFGPKIAKDGKFVIPKGPNAPGLRELLPKLPEVKQVVDRLLDDIAAADR